MMFEDILLYAIFPELFGLPHYIIFGGSKPEPVNGAELLGCPRWVCVILIVMGSGLMAWGLMAYVLRCRVPSDSDEELSEVGRQPLPEKQVASEEGPTET
jgi:hypothetical protein